MFGSLGWEELLVLLAIVALVAGASRVGALGGALGRGVREFRTEASRPDDSETPAEDPPSAALAAPAPIEAAPATELLADLERLHAAGVLTDAEFAAKRDALSTHA